MQQEELKYAVNYAVFSEVISHCFTSFKRGESLLFNRQLECKGELKDIYNNQIDTFHFIIHTNIYFHLERPIIELHMGNNPA